MATPAQQAISRVSPQSHISTGSSRSLASNKKSMSFGSWGSRRPRDSLEKMRQRNNSVAQSPQAPHHRLLTSVRNFSIQVLREDQEEEEKEESDVESSVPPEFQVKFHPPINRNVLCERYPKGKASLLVFILNIIISYAFGAAITGILDIFHTNNNNQPSSNVFQLLRILFQNCISRMFYPIAGFIADVYIGRYRMIQIAILSLFIGYAIMVISFLVEGQLKENSHVVLITIIRTIAFLIITAGGGAFEAAIIPLGVDQLQGASSSETSSYFHFFYFGRNLGMSCGILVYTVVSFITLKLTHNTVHETNHDVFQPLVTITILTVGLVLNLCLSHWYFKNTLWENPVKLVMKVLCYAAVAKRRIPVRRRAFRYGEERKKRIELAKVEYDGIFSAEKVEDVKVFCRICLIMLTMTPTLSSMTAVGIVCFYMSNAYSV